MRSLCRRAPDPECIIDEVIALREEFYDKNPEPDVEGLSDEQADAILGELSDRCWAYVDEHLSPLAKEFYRYRSRSGDENDLADINGGYVLEPNGYPVQEWQISKDKRIVDENGNQLYYSNGQPIMAQRLSDELVEFLIQDGWWSKDSKSEEDLWY